MLIDNEDPDTKAGEIAKELSDHALTKSHARHLSADKCKSIGLKVTMLEDNQRLQDAVLTVHHACIHTLSSTPAFKIIENHKGVAFIQITQTVLVGTTNFDDPQQVKPPAYDPAIETEKDKL